MNIYGNTKSGCYVKGGTITVCCMPTESEVQEAAGPDCDDLETAAPVDDLLNPGNKSHPDVSIEKTVTGTT